MRVRTKTFEFNDLPLTLYSLDKPQVWRRHRLVSCLLHLDVSRSGILGYLQVNDLQVLSRLVATLGAKSNTKKVSRKAILDVDVRKACDTIIQPEVPMALRLQSNLLCVAFCDC